MKYIKYNPEFQTGGGQPFMIIDPDVRVLREAREKAGKEGKERYEIPMIEGNFAQVMIWFINNLPFTLDDNDKPTRKLTIEDTANGYAAIKAFMNPQHGFVELEDAVYRWLVEANKTDGPEAFRMTQFEVTKRLEDTPKEGKPEEEGKRKE